MGTSPLRYIDFFSFKSIHTHAHHCLTYTLVFGRSSSRKESFALGTPRLAAPDPAASFCSTGTNSGIAMESSYEWSNAFLGESSLPSSRETGRWIL